MNQLVLWKDLSRMELDLVGEGLINNIRGICINREQLISGCSFMYRIHIAIISWLLDSGGLLKYRLINIGYTVTRGND